MTHIPYAYAIPTRLSNCQFMLASLCLTALWKKDSLTDGSDEVEPQLQLEESQELLIRSLSTEVLGIM